ncbi:MAG: CopD family protein [Candidatus Dormibacteria bacterium]
MTWFAINLVIHILAACIWIGGQATIAYIMPLLHDLPDRARELGLRFQKLAWSAYAILILTGIANMYFLHISIPDLLHSHIGHLLDVKLILVIISGGAALAHAMFQASSSRKHSRALSALLGSTSLGAAVFAALYGVLIGT